MTTTTADLSVEEKCNKIIEYINKRSKEKDGTDCIVWVKDVHSKSGYGMCRNLLDPSKQSVLVHRLAYAAYNSLNLPKVNENGEKLMVGHLCGERLCVQKSHLVLVTYKDHTVNTANRGSIPQGEDHSSATITEAIALQIAASKFPESHPEYKTVPARAKLFNTTIHVVYQIDMRRTWKGSISTIPLPYRRTRVKTPARYLKRHRNATIDEEKAKEIIASKKHKYDPDYKTQKMRAEELGVTFRTIQAIDGNSTWKYLPRPLIAEFPKPEVKWDEKELEEAFNRVKERCIYASEPNKHVGSPCLEWQNITKRKDGRPWIKIHNKEQAAYVFSCEYKEKRIRPEGLQTRHLCGNEICCEPTHLMFGTAQENALDAVNHEASKHFKLNKERVKAIRKSHEDKSKTKKELAEEYGVNESTISSVIHNKTWKGI